MERGDIMQEETSKKIKENKYKILRMSLILGNVNNDEEALANFETSAREIDAMNGEEFLDTINNKYYKTKNLEEEQKRLKDLVGFIEGRIAQRNALEEDFYNVTGHRITDLEEIKDESKLPEYKNRLACIDKYLKNTQIVDETSKNIKKYQNELDKSYEEKENYEEDNIRLEKELSDLFKKIVADNTIVLRNVEEIDKEIADTNPSVMDSKKTLEIFQKTFRALKKAGISSREEREYLSYIDNAKEDYYNKIERYFLLSIYRLVFVICNEFETIYNKRNKIREILDDRINTRTELNIREEDKLSKLYSLLDIQYEKILKEKEINDNIENLKEKIADSTVELDRYKEELDQKEITDLLEEYSIIKKKNAYQDLDFNLDYNTSINNIEDTYNYQDDESNYEEPDYTNKDLNLKPMVEEQPKDNQIIKISDPTSIDILKVTEKTKNVMIKVGEMLNPKPTPILKEIKPINKPIEEPKPVVDHQEELSSYSMSDDDLSLPDFTDLPTVSSLTGSNTNEVGNNQNSFWGNNDDDFEFPSINGWEE